MPSLDIKVHRCNDPLPAWPEIHTNKELDLEMATIIEQGMASGEPAVVFGLWDHETGKHYAAQTSVAVLEMLMGAIRGAVLNWKENPVENIWKGKKF